MIAKCKEPREYQRRTYEGLGRLTKEVKNVIRPVLGARGFSGVDILENWVEILGADLSQGIIPEKLTFEKEGRTHGTLHVKSAGGAFAMLFEHQKARVIQRINTYFGYPAVSQIRIEQGQLRLKRPQPVVSSASLSAAEEAELLSQVAFIEDDNLRARTYEIGKTLLQKSKK